MDATQSGEHFVATVSVAVAPTADKQVDATLLLFGVAGRDINLTMTKAEAYQLAQMLMAAWRA